MTNKLSTPPLTLIASMSLQSNFNRSVRELEKWLAPGGTNPRYSWAFDLAKKVIKGEKGEFSRENALAGLEHDPKTRVLIELIFDAFEGSKLKCRIAPKNKIHLFDDRYSRVRFPLWMTSPTDNKLACLYFAETRQLTLDGKVINVLLGLIKRAFTNTELHSAEILIHDFSATPLSEGMVGREYRQFSSNDFAPATPNQIDERLANLKQVFRTVEQSEYGQKLMKRIGIEKINPNEPLLL